MQYLIAPTEDFIKGEISFLSADEAPGQTEISVDNGEGFSPNDYIVIGNIGSETAELRQLSSASPTSLTISIATDLSHSLGEKVTVLKYNKRKFYRSSSETGTYTHLSSEGSPTTIAVDVPEGTALEDSNGTSSSWYKATYYNSTTAVETSLDDSEAVKAGDSDYYTSIHKIRSEAGFEDNSYITSEVIARYREEADAEIDAYISSVYSLPFSSAPRLLTHISTLLAAGHLLSKEYGSEVDVDSVKSGQAKINRAEELLQKIIDGTLTLVGVDGTPVDKVSTFKVSGSNNYASGIFDRGEMFNLHDENFKLTNPADPTESSDRLSSYDDTDNWSQV
jgi:phage gp36-like protein